MLIFRANMHAESYGVRHERSELPDTKRSPCSGETRSPLGNFAMHVWDSIDHGCLPHFPRRGEEELVRAPHKPTIPEFRGLCSRYAMYEFQGWDLL